MNNVRSLVDNLAEKVSGLPQPIHVIAVCSGGQTVGKFIVDYLKDKNIDCTYHEVWTDIIDGKATVSRTDFEKDDYVGTALIAEDVIWNGRSVNVTKDMLYKFKDKKPYLAVLLDMNKKADYSIFN